MAVPSAPAAPVVVNVAARTATATWAHPSGSNPPLIDYQLQLSTRSNFSVITSTVSGITGGSSGVEYNMVNMQRATNYWVRVRARNADGYSAWSGGGAFTTLPEAPSAPRNLGQVLSPTSEYTHNSVKVKWSAPSSNGGGQLTGYDVQASTSAGFGSIAASWSGNALIAQLTGLAYGRLYFVRVRAKNSAGAGPWLSFGDAGVTTDFATSYYVPVAPTSLTATRVSDTSQSLSWNLTTSASAPVHRVRVYRWDNVSAAWSPVALLTGAVSSWSDGGTVAGREYQYRVLAENDFAARVKQSAYSSVATVFTTPLTPVGATAKKNDAAGIDVTIAPHPGGYVTDFEVQHRANGGSWATLGTTAALVYTHASPNPSQTHQYRVRAVKGALASGWAQTAVVSLAAPPLAPTNLRLEGDNIYNGDSFPAGTLVELVWDFNAGPDTAGQTEFETRYTFNGWLWETGPSGGAETSVTFDLGLHEGEVFHTVFQVRTKGTPSAPWSDWSDSFLAKAFPYSPTPTITAPLSTVDGVPFEVEWDNNFWAITGTRFLVEVYDGDALVDSQIVTPPNGTDFYGATLDSPLVGGESYDIRVSASRSGGIFWSEPATVTVLADFPVPAPPTVEAYWEPETATAVVTVINPDPVYEWLGTPHNSASTETIGGVVTRTNKFPNPRVETMTALFLGQGTGGTQTNTLETGPTPAGTGQYRRATTVVPATAADAGWIISRSGAGSLTPGVPQRVIFALRSSKSVTTNLFTTIYAGGASSRSVTLGPITLAPGVWTPVDVTIPLTGLEDGYYLRAYAVGLLTSAGDTLDITEIGEIASGDFFDGDTPSSEAPAVSNRVERRTDNGAWVTIGEVEPGGQIWDSVPPLADSLEYRAIAISAVPSTAAGPEIALPWVHHNCPIFVNGGLDFGTAVTAAGMGEHEHAINTVLHQFEGRIKPVAVFGVEESWQVNYAGVLLPDTSRRADWVNLLNQKQIICYRDCRGRRVFGVISAIKFSVANGADWLQFTVTETDYTEGA